MIAQSLKTGKIMPSACTLFELLDTYLSEFSEHSVLAITSKVVSLCEGAVAPLDSIGREELIRQESTGYVDLPDSDYPITFTVIQNTMLPNAGVDESNTAGMYVLWPRDPQATANAVRAYLCERFGVREIGVIITDSTARPLRWGMGGISIAHSGFKEVRDYRNTPDLFGRTFIMETAAIAGGLAATAALVMGDGAECTPLAVLTDLPFVEFQDRDPSPSELKALELSIDNDLYGPIWKAVEWKPGGAAHGQQPRAREE